MRVARAVWPEDKATLELLTRAASAPATTPDAAWAGPLAALRVQELLLNLGPVSVGSQLLKQGISHPMSRHVERAGVPSAQTARGSRSELGRQVAVDFEPGADLHKNESGPGHSAFPKVLSVIIFTTP